MPHTLTSKTSGRQLSFSHTPTESWLAETAIRISWSSPAATAFAKIVEDDLPTSDNSDGHARKHGVSPTKFSPQQGRMLAR